MEISKIGVEVIETEQKTLAPYDIWTNIIGGMKSTTRDLAKRAEVAKELILRKG